MDSYRIPTIISVLVIVVVVAAAAVITVTQRDRADAASAHTLKLERTLAETRTELGTTQAELEVTSDSLSAAEQEIQDTRSASAAITRQRAALSKQVKTCRYVVAINDHLLQMASRQQQATAAVLRKRMPSARLAVGRAHRQAAAVQILVQRSGYRSLDALVSACTTQ